jgi:hypothetical protein
MAKKDATNAPLTPAVLHILLALSTEERHGYGIMKQVEADSRGKVKMGPGTLYGSIGRMIEAGLIRESNKKVDPDMDDERRVYYKITARRGIGAVPRSCHGRETKTALAEYGCVWQLNSRYRDTGPGTRNCFASIRSRTMNASAREWSKPSTTFSESAPTKKEDCSVALFGCSPKHPRKLFGRTKS